MASRLAKSRPRRAHHNRAGLWLIALFVLIGLAVIGGRIGRLFQHGAQLLDRQPVKLERVADGDTLLLIDKVGQSRRVRLAGIDTPELGSAASFRSALCLAEMLESADRIYLEIDPRQPADRYGRALGWVFVIRDGKELLVQEELVRQGLAELYPDSRADKYLSRLRRALPR